MSPSPGLVRLQRAAERLAAAAPQRNARRPGARTPPALLILTDPHRTPDPLALAERLPPGTGLVYRAFGAPDALATGQALAAAARRRDLLLLIGADAELSAACGADGVHLPERRIGDGPRLRARYPRWLLTGAVHSVAALRRAERAGLDAALLSAVFESASLSAGRPLGPVRFAAMIRAARLPVYALGGVDLRTVRRLSGAGAGGVAAVGAASREEREPRSRPGSR